jgi:hypothetical protein
MTSLFLKTWFAVDRHFIEKVETKLASREKEVEAMRGELDLFQQRKVAWENDREELNSQILILTEERCRVTLTLFETH